MDYFDEGSATDFIQIVHDGELKKTRELFLLKATITTVP